MFIASTHYARLRWLIGLSAPPFAQVILVAGCGIIDRVPPFLRALADVMSLTDRSILTRPRTSNFALGMRSIRTIRAD